MWLRLAAVVVVMTSALAGAAHADDDSKPVTCTVDGEHGIHVDVTYQTLTGTYHGATHLELHTAKARLHRAQPDLERLPQLPLIDKALVIDPDHWTERRALDGVVRFCGGTQDQRRRVRRR